MRQEKWWQNYLTVHYLLGFSSATDYKILDSPPSCDATRFLHELLWLKLKQINTKVSMRKGQRLRAVAFPATRVTGAAFLLGIAA